LFIWFLVLPLFEARSHECERCTHECAMPLSFSPFA
jgi:hypothetical protein